MPQAIQHAKLTSITPFFIVRDVSNSLTFYRDQLGFQVAMASPDDTPFFAIIARDGVQIMLKMIAKDIAPQPNPQRHPWAKWDAFIHTPDPDAYAEELTERGTAFHTKLTDTEDGLRGFELKDPDGYVIFFGHAR